MNTAPPGRLRALLFDVDGTLADTEREGHLVACNEAFAALGLPIRWTWETYRPLLAIPGNENRMRLALSELGTMTPAEVEETAAALYRVKQARYLELVPRLPLRAGVERLLREAAARDVRLAIVSTSSEPQIQALLQHHLPDLASRFDPILGQQSGPKVGPGGRLYERCLSELDVEAGEAVAIEDAADGCRAAVRAGVACVVVPSEHERDADFTGATWIAESLEDVSLADLQRIVGAAGQKRTPPPPRTSRSRM